MSCEGSVIDPVTVPGVSVTDPAMNRYYAKLSMKKLRGGSGTANSTQIKRAENINKFIRIHEVHLFLLDVIEQIVKNVSFKDYVLPTLDPSYDATGTDVTVDQLASETIFVDYIKNVAVNTTLTATQDTYIGFIAQKMFQLFIRVESHIKSAPNDSELQICGTGDETRLFYMLIETCLFCLEFSYN